MQPKWPNIVPVATVAAAVLAFAACGTEREPDKPMPEAQVLMINSGCSSCHGRDGEGGMAPAWQGLYMKKIVMEDGSKQLVDDAYLFRSIKTPSAQQVKGFSQMPPNTLTDAQIQMIVDWIKTLK